MPKKGYGPETAEVISIALELGFIIALPIVFLGMLGKYLDDKYHAGYFVYLGIAVAITFTTIWLYRRFDRMLQKLKQSAEKKQHNKKDSEAVQQVNSEESQIPKE